MHRYLLGVEFGQLIFFKFGSLQRFRATLAPATAAVIRIPDSLFLVNRLFYRFNT